MTSRHTIVPKYATVEGRTFWSKGLCVWLFGSCRFVDLKRSRKRAQQECIPSDCAARALACTCTTAIDVNVNPAGPYSRRLGRRYAATTFWFAQPVTWHRQLLSKTPDAIDCNLLHSIMRPRSLFAQIKSEVLNGKSMERSGPLKKGVYTTTARARQMGHWVRVL